MDEAKEREDTVMTASRPPHTLALAGLIVLLSGSSQALAAQGRQPRCSPNDDHAKVVMIFLKGLVTEPDSVDAALADSLGVSGLSPESVRFVTDERVCARAARGIDRMDGRNLKTRRVYVAQLGNVFAVSDPSDFMVGEWSPLVLMDDKFKVLEVLMLF